MVPAYLLLGLTFVMLLLHLYNDIPQLNLGLFLLRGSDLNTGDPERMRLSGTGGVAPKYTQVRTWNNIVFVVEFFSLNIKRELAKDK